MKIAVSHEPGSVIREYIWCVA